MLAQAMTRHVQEAMGDHFAGVLKHLRQTKAAAPA
jgi:hypothetical protein